MTGRILTFPRRSSSVEEGREMARRILAMTTAERRGAGLEAALEDPETLMSIVEALERQLCLRSDDLEEAQRLGRLVQVARVRSHPAPRRRARRW